MPVTRVTKCPEITSSGTNPRRSKLKIFYSKSPLSVPVAKSSSEHLVRIVRCKHEGFYANSGFPRAHLASREILPFAKSVLLALNSRRRDSAMRDDSSGRAKSEEKRETKKKGRRCNAPENALFRTSFILKHRFRAIYPSERAEFR